MKKLTVTLCAALLIAASASAFTFTGNDRAITVNRLPQKAQQFIKQHFNDKTVAYAKQDTDLFDGDYTIGFTDGGKVEFTQKGEWKDVECKSAVPTEIVPAQIRTYVAKHYPNVQVVDIERDRKNYEVKLSNRLSLEFDSKFNLIEIDR